jgi:hypothetical protein
VTRTSQDEYREGRLWQGYDYTNQAWVIQGRYVRCGHNAEVKCSCFGRLHEGENTQVDTDLLRARG